MSDAVIVSTARTGLAKSWKGALNITHGATVGGRPLLHVSLALNHALSGPAVWSYHAANLVIHVLAALALFGVARRTLQRTPLAPQAFPAAWFTALLWTLHPLQTESVTYVVQRAESLCGLLYLAALYGFIRGSGSGSDRRGRAWLAASVAAAWLGAATKEVMATAPLLILLHDRAFVAGSFRAAWRARRGRGARAAAVAGRRHRPGVSAHRRHSPRIERAGRPRFSQHPRLRRRHRRGQAACFRCRHRRHEGFRVRVLRPY